MDIAGLQQRIEGLFPDLLGIRFVEASLDLVRAELAVRDELCTVPGVLHGGAIMAFADTLGAVATVLNLSPGASTTTLESKTNFLSAARSGATISGTTTPIHRGRQTMVWQTRVECDGKLVALVTQTQMVLAPRAAP